MLDNPFIYRASSHLRLDKCSDGCVWGENSRGWLVECWRGDAGMKDMEREKYRERGRDGSSSLRMHNEGETEARVWDEIWRLVFTRAHTHTHKPEKIQKCSG